MKKGGRPTPEDAGLKLTHRDKIYEHLQNAESGSLFRLDGIIDQLGDETANDLLAMKEYDYVHVKEGWHTAVREGKHVRMMPSPHVVASNWAAMNQDKLVDFGDRIANKKGWFPWEPIEGYRFRCARKETTGILTLSHMKIRIELSVPWLIDDSDAGIMYRCIHDLPQKGLGRYLIPWLAGNDKNKEQMTSKISTLEEYAQSYDQEWHEADPEIRGRRPISYVDAIKEMVSEEKQRLKR